MNSIIFKVVARLLLPVMILFSLFLLLRGHQEAGGGFVGGLVAGAAVVIYALAFDPPSALRLLPTAPEKLIGAGLLLALFSTLLPVPGGHPVMTSIWFTKLGLPGWGTPALFDGGVYVVVMAVMIRILLPLIEETQ